MSATDQVIAIVKDESCDYYYPFNKEQNDALLAIIKREQRAVTFLADRHNSNPELTRQWLDNDENWK